MAKALDVEMPSLEDLQAAFLALPESLAVKHLTPAVRSATAPAVAALRSKVREGATGKLKKSIAAKTKTYKDDATVVGMVGFKIGQGRFTKGGKSTPLNQVFQEFGTEERETLGPIASSYNRKKFKVVRLHRFTPTMGKGQLHLQPVSKYNFYYRNWQGGTVKTGRVKPQNYLQEAWSTSDGAVKNELQRELFRRLAKAVKEFAYRQGRSSLSFG